MGNFVMVLGDDELLSQRFCDSISLHCSVHTVNRDITQYIVNISKLPRTKTNCGAYLLSFFDVATLETESYNAVEVDNLHHECFISS